MPNFTLGHEWSSFFTQMTATRCLATVGVKSGKMNTLFRFYTKGEASPAQCRMCFLVWIWLTLMTIGCGGSPSFDLACSLQVALSNMGFASSSSESCKSCATKSVCGDPLLTWVVQPGEYFSICSMFPGLHIYLFRDLTVADRVSPLACSQPVIMLISRTLQIQNRPKLANNFFQQLQSSC